MEKKKILYIINPKSGIGRKRAIEKEIKLCTDKSDVEFDIIYTKRRGHATEIARGVRDEVDVVVAVGGDGTVNEVGTGIAQSTTALGIVPCGSGNGLARELDIPLRTSMAIEVVNECFTRDIDVLKVGNRLSLNVAGVGFDAYVSHLFANKRTRGPLQYMNLITKEYPKYNPLDYVLDVDGDIYKRTAFLISFANSSQWGNDIHIAPNALVDDGMMDVCIISEFPDTAVPSLLLSLLSQSIGSNKYDEMIRTRRVELLNSEPVMGHIDGEPTIFEPHTTIETMPKAIKVVAPSDDFFSALRFIPTRVRKQFLSTVREPINEIKQMFKDI